MAQEPTSEPVSVGNAARDTLGSVRQLAADAAELAALEARRAGSAVAWIAALGVGIAVAVSAFWSLGAAAVAVLLHEGASSLAGVLALIGVANLLLALIMALVVRRLARRFGFPALRRVLLHSEADNHGIAEHS